MVDNRNSAPARRFSEAAVTCLEEAFMLCIPKPGGHIQVVGAAKLMGLEDQLGTDYGQQLAHAITQRLHLARRVEISKDSSRRIRATRLPESEGA